ncbi:uncharacterized protein EV154DRAFT_459974 [Mucor mucedo]|uniref:Uncharacterized protein n=1 Tax=Mucor saturninus TaxID=64648 RepID=A0A8H7UZN4_9FUNG|nr:uncharacterized protein EV154DRAFT_459974 [Mucor mucedo]KAG2204651.1 hypothetical protein INT47_011946 [Mucor saturninus]KAI7894201.1 hypothetical protein EV154DRAFT_459974 [Mucor mucedo]
MSSAVLNRLSFALFHSIARKNSLHLRPSTCQRFSTSSIFFRDPNSVTEPTPYSIRRTWSRADTEKLLILVTKYGNKWKVFANYFPGRTSFCIRAHYFSVTHDTTRWTLEEKKILQQRLGSEQDPENIDWEAIQSSLPKRRTIARIKQFWQNSIHPTLNRGSWIPAETERLKKLVSKHGKDWETIAKEIGTRSEDQCRNKWAYEVSTLKKGEFSKEEDDALLQAVKKYGIDEFQKIQTEMKSQRSISQLRTRYHNFLDPDVDRSPWTEEEKKVAGEMFAELKNLRAVKIKMNSKRSIRDMYNQLRNR